ncbi:hypothetical protein SB766_03215 [Pseudomonas sp. SIMBA_077]
MSSEPVYLIASVRQPCHYRPSVTAIVLFGLEVEGNNTPPVYMEIRFIDYPNLQVEGEHLMLSLQDALESARVDYGIEQADWRDMNQEEIDRIPW